MNIEKRLEALQAEHEKVCEQIQEHTNIMSQLQTRRIQIEGAFQELQSLQKEIECSCDKAE